MAMKFAPVNAGRAKIATRSIGCLERASTKKKVITETTETA